MAVLPPRRIGNAQDLPEGANPLRYISADDINGLIDHVDGWVDIKEYGAVGDGVTDDTAAIQAALTNGAGKTVLISTGTFIVTPVLDTTYLRVSSGTTIVGLGSSSVIKVKNGTGNYGRVFGPVTVSPAVTDVIFSNFVVDQNPSGNGSSDPTISDDSHRQNAILFYGVTQRIMVRDMIFSPATGRQTVALNGIGAMNFTVRDSFFHFERIGATSYDNSLIYFEGQRWAATGNTFENGSVYGAAMTAIETHGGPGVVSNNRVRNFNIGVNITSSSSNSPTENTGIVVEGNNFSHMTTMGVQLWPITGTALKNVRISDNIIDLAQATAVSQGMANASYSGIRFNYSAGSAADSEDITIENNTIRCEQEERNVSSGQIAGGIVMYPYGNIRNLVIRGNTVRDSPAQGIIVALADVAKSAEHVTIQDNIIVDAGNSTLSAYRYALRLYGLFKNVNIDGNTVSDTGSPNNGQYAWHFSGLDTLSKQVNFSDSNRSIAASGTPLLNSLGTTVIIPSFSVQAFGAACDGVTDDSAAIQATIAALPATGGKLVFPAGKTCIVTPSSSVMTITSKSNIVIEGNGATVKAANTSAHSAGNHILRIIGTSGTPVTKVTIRDLSIDSNRANRTPAEVYAYPVLVGEYVSNVLFENVRSINGLTDGFRVDTSYPAVEASYPTDITFVNCESDNAYRCGLGVIAVKRISIVGGRYHGTTGTAPNCGISAETNADTTYGIQGFVVDGARMDSNVGYGYSIAGPVAITGAVARNVTLDGNGSGAMWISSSTNPIVDGARISDHSAPTTGLIVIPSSSPAVTDPVFLNIVFTGITAAASKACLYIHSTASGAIVENLSIHGSSAIGISANGANGRYSSIFMSNMTAFPMAVAGAGTTIRDLRVRTSSERVYIAAADVEIDGAALIDVASSNTTGAIQFDNASVRPIVRNVSIRHSSSIPAGNVGIYFNASAIPRIVQGVTARSEGTDFTGANIFNFVGGVAGALISGNYPEPTTPGYRPSLRGVSGDRGDTSQTLTVGSDFPIQRWATALTVNRTVTLSTTGAVNGNTFRIIRTGLGGYTLNIGGLKTIPIETAAWAEVTYNGSAWVLTGYATIDTPSSSGGVIDVRDYGAKCDGVTDDTAAFQAALNSGIQVLVPSGTSKITSALTVPTHGGLIGVGWDKSIISYTGSGDVFTNATPTARLYGWQFANLTLSTSTGVRGFYLSAVSNSMFRSVKVSGFTTAFELYSPTAGYAVYNRFEDCNAAQNATGYYLHGQSTNANTFIACRSNLNTSYGWRIQDSNENHLLVCQVEDNAGVGVSIEAPGGPGTTELNTITDTRFEGTQSPMVNIGTNVRDTIIVGSYFVGSNPITDAGARTQIFGGHSNAPNIKSESAIPSAGDGTGIPFILRRISNGGANALGSNDPMLSVDDSVTSSGNPTSVWIKTERATGEFVRGTRGGTRYWNVDATGSSYQAGGLAIGGIQYATPTTGQTVVLNANIYALVLKPAGTLAALTITMPASPDNGQVISISSTQIITAVTHNPGAGQTMNNGLTTLAAGGSASYIYRLADTSWYKVN